MEYRARVIAPLFASKEQRGVGYVDCFSHPLEWNPLPQDFHEVLPLLGIRGHRGVDESWSDSIRGNSMWRQLDRQHFGEHPDSRLAYRVFANARSRQFGGAGRNINYPSTLLRLDHR